MKVTQHNNLNKEVESLFQIRIALEGFKDKNYSVCDYGELNIIDQVQAKISDSINMLSPRFFVKSSNADKEKVNP